MGPPRAVDPGRRPVDAPPVARPDVPPPVVEPASRMEAAAPPTPSPMPPLAASPIHAAGSTGSAAAVPAPVEPPPPSHAPFANGSPAPAIHAEDAAPASAGGPNGAPLGSTGCTAPQLRRFIKSRPYVPMHELRRRFGINGPEDDVCAIDLGDRRLFVGLPPREGSLLGELLRGGDIGYELSLDPQVPVVVGLYPMRPVART
jgi:hypothetical protein